MTDTFKSTAKTHTAVGVRQASHVAFSKAARAAGQNLCDFFDALLAGWGEMSATARAKAIQAVGRTKKPRKVKP